MKGFNMKIFMRALWALVPITWACIEVKLCGSIFQDHPALFDRCVFVVIAVMYVSMLGALAWFMASEIE